MPLFTYLSWRWGKVAIYAFNSHRFRGIASPDDRDQAERIICGSYLNSKRNEECANIVNEKRAKILPSLHLINICILLKDRIRTSN